MATLPTPGASDGVWGTELNTWLQVSMNADGTPDPVAITAAVSGYRQLTLTYNGGAGYVIDCLVGQGWDSAVGGLVWGMFPVPMLFGVPGPNLPCAATIAGGSGVVQAFTYYYDGSMAAFDGGGAPLPIDIPNPSITGSLGSGYVVSVAQGANVTVDNTDPMNPIISTGSGTLPTYTGTVGISLTDDSTAGMVLTENGSGSIVLRGAANTSGYPSPVLDDTYGNGVGLSSIDHITITAGTALGGGQQVFLYTSATSGVLPPATGYTAFGYTANSPYSGTSELPQGALWSWNETFGQWGPISQPVGNILVQTYNRAGASYTNLEVCPWYNAQPVGLVSTAGPRGADIYPFAVLAPGDNIGVSFSQTLQLIAAGTLAVPAWDYVDLTGTITVWDAAGTNLLEASFVANQIRSDTVTTDVTFTQVRNIGLDLGLVTVNTTDDSIETAAGGAYNISTNVYASWD